MYCKICGAALNPGDVFCKNCGASNNNQNNAQPVTPTVEPNPVGIQNYGNSVMPQGQQAQPFQNVQPVSPQPNPTQNFQQPMAPIMPQPQPVNFEQPMPQQPQPVFTSPTTTPTESKSKTPFLIIGIVVGILAVAVVVYLLIDAGVFGKKEVTNVGGTTVTVHDNLNIVYGGYKFTINGSYVSGVSSEGLAIDTGSYKTIIQYAETPSYGVFTEANLRQAFAAYTTMKINLIKEKQYSGLKYWQIDMALNTGNKVATGVYTARSTGGIWMISAAEKTETTYLTTSQIEEILSIIKNATVSTASNMEENNFFDQIMNVDLNVEETPVQSTDSAE